MDIHQFSSHNKRVTTSLIMFLCSAISEGILGFALPVKGQSVLVPLRVTRDPPGIRAPPLDDVISSPHILTDQTSYHGSLAKGRNCHSESQWVIALSNISAANGDTPNCSFLCYRMFKKECLQLDRYCKFLVGKPQGKMMTLKRRRLWNSAH